MPIALTSGGESVCIEALVADLKAKGVQFLSDEIALCPGLLDGVKNIFFVGPDGERFEFFEYYNR